ncbi:MAG: hypothetical protein ACON4F_00450 [Candidatus Puniceispirillaceae bacterium]
MRSDQIIKRNIPANISLTYLRALTPAQRQRFLDQIRFSTLTRFLSFASELDSPHGTGGGSCFAPESWQVAQIAELDEAQMILELVPTLDLDRRVLPARRIMRDLCQHQYRRWDAANGAFDYEGVSCPYRGTDYFNAKGAEVQSAAEDSCSQQLASGCKKRFNGVLPFLGFPGVQ